MFYRLVIISKIKPKNIMSSGIFAWFTTLVNPDMNNLNILIEPFCVGVRPVPDGLRILAWPLAEF